MQGELRFKAIGNTIKFEGDLKEASLAEMLLMARFLQNTSNKLMGEVMIKLGSTVMDNGEQSAPRIITPNLKL